MIIVPKIMVILAYFQRSHLSEYKRYRRHAFIIISIEGSTRMPDPALPPHNILLKFRGRLKTPLYKTLLLQRRFSSSAQDTLNQLEVHVTPSLSSLFSTLLFVSLRAYLAFVTLVVLYSVLRSLISFGII